MTILLVLASIIGSLVLLYWIISVFSLNTSLDKTSMTEDAFISDPRHMLVGKEGVAITPLRPVGKGDFSGELIDISSTQGIIEQGDRVRISHVDGPSIFVTRI